MPPHDKTKGTAGKPTVDVTDNSLKAAAKSQVGFQHGEQQHPSQKGFCFTQTTQSVQQQTQVTLQVEFLQHCKLPSSQESYQLYAVATSGIRTYCVCRTACRVGCNNRPNQRIELQDVSSAAIIGFVKLPARSTPRSSTKHAKHQHLQLIPHAYSARQPHVQHLCSLDCHYACRFCSAPFLALCSLVPGRAALRRSVTLRQQQARQQQQQQQAQPVFVDTPATCWVHCPLASGSSNAP